MKWTVTKFDKAIVAAICFVLLTVVQQVMLGGNLKSAIAGAIASVLAPLMVYLKANAKK